MTFREPVVYFHGMPGGPGELKAFSHSAPWLGAEGYFPDRRAMSPGASLSVHFDGLATAINSRFGNSTVRFVGFSLGAYVALEVASRMGSQVGHISLVSAAAPLATGHFLPDMSGQFVFQSARGAPFVFEALTTLQSLGVRVAPGRIFDALFADAVGADRDLAAEPFFRAAIMEALQKCFQEGSSNYRRELMGYVRDWSSVLPLVRQPVELWHGSLDNWAPPAMADALAAGLPNVTSLHMLEGRSHYSALQTFLEPYSGRAG